MCAGQLPPDRHPADGPERRRFDPGGNLLVSTDGSQISLWSAADGQKLAGRADDRQPPVLGGFGPRYRSVVLLQSGWASLVDGDSAKTLAMFPPGWRKADPADLLQRLGVVGDGSRGVAADPRSGQIEVWALQTLPQQSRLGTVSSASPSAQMVASC